MKTITSIDTESFAFSGAPATPANTQMTSVDFPSDVKVMRMVAESRAARNRYLAEKTIAGCKAAFETVTEWYRKRATRRALADLDSRLLRDIGLERSDIDAYVAESKPGFIARGFSAFAKAVKNWYTAQQTRAALLRLTDAQLADIGLSRHDVETLAKEIRGGRVDSPASVQDAVASAETRPTAKTRKVVMPVNSNHVSSWFMSPRRVA